jgi:hypothetical protein
MTKFGVPNTLVFDNTTYFSSLKLTYFSIEKRIILKYTTNYYPQGNGLDKSNKGISTFLFLIVTTPPLRQPTKRFFSFLGVLKN